MYCWATSNYSSDVSLQSAQRTQTRTAKVMLQKYPIFNKWIYEKFAENFACIFSPPCDFYYFTGCPDLAMICLSLLTDFIWLSSYHLLSNLDRSYWLVSTNHNKNFSNGIPTLSSHLRHCVIWKRIRQCGLDSGFPFVWQDQIALRTVRRLRFT